MDFGRLTDTIFGIGLKAEEMAPGQALARVVIVYVVTLAIVRLGKKRFMGRGTAFDVIIGVMVGSIASRAVTGNAPLGPALAGVAGLLALHWLFSALAVRWHGFGVLVKGKSRAIMEAGTLDEEALRRAHLTRNDVEEDLREKQVFDLGEVEEARIERDGNLSIRKRAVEPRVVEVEVRDGVQRVRIEIA